MPLTITDIRAKYPQYAGLSDEDLAKRLYDKLYAGKLDWNAYRSQVMPAPAAPAAVAPTTIESPDDATGLTPTEEPDTADNLIGLAKRSAARVLGAGATLGEQGLRKITTGVADRAGLSDSDRQILKALSPVGSLESGLSTVRGAAEKYEADVVAALSPDVRRSIELQFIERDEEGRLRFGEGATDKWWWTAQTIDLGAMMAPGIGTSAVAARMAYGSRYAQVLTELGSKKIATSVAIKEAEKQALEAAAKAGVIAGGLAEGTLAGGFNARQVEETIAQIDEPTMMNYAPYRALRDKGMTHEEARSRIATDQGFAAGISTAVVTGLTGAPLNALMGRWLAGGAVGKTRAGAAGKVLTGEMAQEFVQEGSEAAIANIAERPITGKDTWEGVLEQAITGAAVAVVPGAAGGVVAGVRVPAPKGKGEDTPPPDPTPGLRARADALEKSRAQLKSVLEDASNPNIAITQQDIEEARDAYRGTLVEYAQELIRSGQLNDENQQAVANALRDAQRAGRELPAAPVPGVIRDNVKKPVSPTAQAGDEKAAGQKKAEPAEEVPEGLNEVETARYDALQRVATADTLDAAQLTELTAEGLARTNREGRPLLTPEGRRQRKALADRMAAAETAQAEAEKQQVAKKPQKAKKPVEPAVEKAPEVPVATTQQVLKPYRLKRARESLRAPDFDALERVRARAAIDEDEATPLLRAGLIQKTDDGYWIKPRGRRELRDYNITGKVPVERAPTPREPLTLDASRRQAAEARRTAPPTPEQAAAQKEAAFQQRAQLKTTEERRAAIQKERDRRAALNQVGDQTIEQAPYTVQEPATTPLADTLRQAMERGEPLPVTASEAPAPPARPATEIAPQAPAFVGRKRQPDAVSIVGVHYSKQPGLSKLDPRRAGTGSAGGERRRFGPGQYGTSGDPYGRRIYFYQQTDENLPAKETAVSGQIPYRVRLDNLYDASADPKGFRADAGPNADLFEELVSDAGYDGFVTDPPAGIDAPVAVVFNVAKQIPVEDVSAQPADTAASEAPTDGGLQVMEVVGGQTERGPLLAPNGKRSKLGPAQYAMVRTPEFKKWFGDWEKFALMPGNVWNDADGEVSKVVDPETGEPLEVYHGTTEGGYDVFEQSQSRRGISATFFTASYRTARSYSGTGTEVDLEAPEAPPDGYRVEQQEDGTWAYFWSDSATPDRLGFESYEEAIAELWAQEDKNGVPGIYSVFLNIRDPLEEDFDGANWDGNRQGGYEVVNEEGETQYDDQGRGFFADRDDAYRLAFKTGGDVIPAGDLPFTTDDVVSQAKRAGSTDGAIMRNVVDEGPFSGYWDTTDVFAVFKPEQVKSSTQNIGTFDATDPRITAAEAPQAPVFYSALIRAISAAKIAKGTGEQWLGMLRNISGVKPEEIEYYDLAEWLGDRKGVTREEIIDYLRANELQIQEIKYEEQTLNVASPYWGPEVDRVLSDHPGYAPDALEIKLANDEAAYEEVTKKHPELAYDEEWYKVVLGSVFPPGRGVASLPRYNRPGLITPGGMQYQEMLFQIPTERTALERQLAEVKREMRALNARGEPYPDDLIDRSAAIRAKIGVVPITREYDSPHWTPGNVVAHVRYNIRVGADGARTLFLEEVQSDWHQEGRKKGYSGSEKPGPLGEPPGYTLHNETQEARDAGMDIPPTAPEIWLYTDPDGNYSRRYVSALDALAAARENYDFRNSVGGGARVPNAPFKTTWPMLVMKRMMRYAADNGIDKVAWTTGAQQAERYSLRVVADTLSGMWEPKKDQPGTYRIWVTASNRAGHVQVMPEMSSPAELEATVGKELATKILAQSPGDYVEYGGVDLDLGGGGMRTFYDKELVNETNKLLKKYGAKVRTDYIGDMAFGVYDRGPHAAYRWQVVSRDKRIPSGTPFASRTEAQAEADRRNKESKDKGVLPAHAFDITPKLRDGVRGGLPLFASGWTATGSTPAGINWRMLRGVVERVESELGVRANFAMVKAALPGYLQSYAKDRRPQGLFYNNPAGGPEVWLIGEYLADEKTAYETAMHEIVGHMGLRALLGKDYARTMDRIIASFPDVVRAAAARNRIPLNAADARKYGMDPAKLDDPVVRRAMQRLAAEEMVAYTAGSMLTKRGAKSDLNLLSRIVSAVRAVLRRMGLLNKFTETDIYNLIYRARDHVTRKPAKVHVREAKHDSDVAAAKKRAPAAEYAPRSTIDDGPLLGMPDGADLPAGRRGSAQPFKTARTAAQAYKRKYGIATPDVRTYAKTDPVTARRVADAFESMPHTPNDPKVRDAYAALAREVLAQYQFIKDTGLKVEFMRPGEDPYAGELRQMMDDVRFNNHIWVYPTEEGFGENTDQYSQGHPMLAPTDEYAGNKRMVLNDVFRIVHDYFGHVQEGNGFTFTGEENAWRIHATMFTDAALPALASETRGQASWVRYGPKEKENRGAPVADVHYAPQKAGLLPEEFWYPTPEERPEVLAAEAAEEPSEQPAVPPLELARTARAELLEKGGFTVDPRTGAAPTEGWAVSLDKAAEKVFDKAPTAAQLAAYVRKNAEALETGYFGGWRRGDGKFVLDVITVMPEADRDAVVEAGQLAEQDAVYNLRTGEEVPLPKLSSSKLRARRAIQQVAGLLTPAERAKLTQASAERLIEKMKELPSAQDMAAAALAGQSKRGWYRDAAETIVNIFGPDAPRFAALLGATSPRAPVAENLTAALRIWTGWVSEGRPTDEAAIVDIMRRRSRVFGAWKNNVIATLQAEDPGSLVLSGPKANSFADNLRGVVNEVTLDGWMAVFAAVDQKEWFGGARNISGTDPGKGTGYLAYAARVRETAKYLTELTGDEWTPAEVQETIWSWAKALTEAAESAKRSPAGIIANGELTDEIINATPDFATLFAGPEHEAILRGAGYGKQLDRAIRTQTDRAGARRQAFPPAEGDRQRLIDRASRIEAYRAGSAVEDVPFSILGGNTGNDALDRFTAKIGGPRRTLKQMWRDLTEGLLERANAAVFDDLYGIKRAGDLAGISAADVGFKNAHLSRSAAELTQAVIEYGPPVWHRDGGHVVAGIDGDMGLVRILRPLGDNVNLWLTYMVAKRADRLMGEGRENLFSQDEIDAALDLGRLHPEFDVVAAEYANLQKKVLDFAEEAGVIDPDARAMWEHADYIPFYRVIENGVVGPNAGGALGKVRNQIRRLRGGAENLGDPLDNIVRNWHSLFDASLKAQAARTVVDALDGTGLVSRAPQVEITSAIVPAAEVAKFIRQNPILVQTLTAVGLDPARLPPEAFVGLQKMLAVQAPTDEDIISVWRNGKREYWHAHDEMLYASLMNIHRASWGPLMEILRFPKRLVTATITSTPQFGVKNFWRDMWHAFVQGAVGNATTIIPGLDSARGAIEQFREGPNMRALLAGGGSFTHGYIRAGDTAGAAASIRRSLRKISPSEIVLDSPAKVWRFYRDLLNAAENSHRVSMYLRMQETGASRLDAMYEARDLLDFAKRGNNAVIRFLIESVPFLNARMQGLHRLARGPDGNKAVFTAIAMRGLLLTAATVAIVARYHDDERYKELTDAQKTMYWHFFDVLEEGDHWALPKPFEVGTIFGTLPEALLDALITNAEEPDAAKQSLKLVGHAFGEALSLKPEVQAVWPLVELAINRNTFTGAPVLTMGDEAVLPEDQDSPRTSPTYRMLARAMPEFAPDALRSPKQLEHLGRGYLGNIQDYVLLATDSMARWASGEPTPPERATTDIPGLRDFRKTGPSRHTKYVDAMYTIADEAAKVDASIRRATKAATEQGDARALELETEFAPLLDVRKDFVDAVGTVNELRREQREVQLDPDMTADAKRKLIDEIQVEINEVARGVWDLRPGGRLNPEVSIELIGAAPEEQRRLLQASGMTATAELLESVQ